MPAWTETDAKGILQSSPWAQVVVAGIAPLQTEANRREGGAMGLPQGIGFDGVTDTRGRITLPSSVFAKSDSTPVRRADPVIRIGLRWESALAIRAAEIKAHEDGTPLSSDDAYCIAIYGIPGSYFGDPKKLGSHLRPYALIRREGKKDVNPSVAEVYQFDNGAAVLYTFPKSIDIEPQDTQVYFQAEVGRLKVAHTFKLEDMKIGGKLAL